MEKELVEIIGRSEEVGKPLLYGTSPFFMDYFGINSIDELPKIKEFTDTENQIGAHPEVEFTSRAEEQSSAIPNLEGSPENDKPLGILPDVDSPSEN